MEKCAKFISDLLEYEELQEPNKLPKIIPSPAKVLEWQAVDSFDFANVLCSLLIGCGYDAYVVYGIAPREITTKDKALMECPFPIEMTDIDDQDDPEVDKDEEHMTSKKPCLITAIEGNSVTKPPVRQSDFDVDMKKTRDFEAEKTRLAAITIDDDQPDFERDDEYGQSRLHC